MIRPCLHRIVLSAVVVAVTAHGSALPAQGTRTAVPTLTTLSTSTSNPLAGSAFELVLSFSGPVLEDSVVVQLRSSDRAITLPETATLHARSGSQLTVTARVGRPRADQRVTLSATAVGRSLTHDVMVRTPRRLVGLTFASDTILRGSAVTATALLDQPAHGEEVIGLSHGGGLALSATVSVLSPSSSGSVSVSSLQPGTKTVTATLNGSSVSRTLTVVEGGVIALGLELPYTSASPGVTMNGTVLAKALELPPGGAIVSLSASPAGILTIPSTVTVTQANSWLPFPITVGQVPSQTTVTLTATHNAITKSVQLTVTP